MPDTQWLIVGGLLAVPVVWAVVSQHGVNRRRAQHPTSDERGYGADQTPTGFEPAPPDDGHDIDEWDLPDRIPGVHVNRLTHLNGHHHAGEEAL